jgi:hypothetical protein
MQISSHASAETFNLNQSHHHYHRDEKNRRKTLVHFKMYFYDFFLQYSLCLLFLCNVLSCEIAQNVPGLLFRIAQVLKKGVS